MEEKKDEIIMNEDSYYYEGVMKEDNNKKTEGLNRTLFILFVVSFIPYFCITFITLFGYQFAFLFSTGTDYGFAALFRLAFDSFIYCMSVPILIIVPIMIVAQFTLLLVLLLSGKFNEYQNKFIVNELVLIGGSILGVCMFPLMTQFSLVFLLIVIIVVCIFAVWYLIGKRDNSMKQILKKFKLKCVVVSSICLLGILSIFIMLVSRSIFFSGSNPFSKNYDPFSMNEPKVRNANENECNDLKKFALQGNNLAKLGWDLDDINTWDGIYFDEEGYVDEINLIAGADLEGEFVVSDFIHLELIQCGNNVLTKVKVDDCDKLVTVECSYNNISELSINNCNSLDELYCGNNLLESLDLTQSSSLGIVNCSNNRLLDIILPTNNNIVCLTCYNNYLQDFTMFKTIENVKYEPQLVRFNSEISKEDLELIRDISAKSTIVWNENNANCDGVVWTYKDGKYYIKSLEFGECRIEGDLNISNLEELVEIEIWRNMIDNVSIENCPELESINLCANGIKSIQLVNIPKIKFIYIENNDLPQSMKDELRKTYDVDDILYKDEVQVQ